MRRFSALCCAALAAAIFMLSAANPAFAETDWNQSLIPTVQTHQVNLVDWGMGFASTGSAVGQWHGDPVRVYVYLPPGEQRRKCGRCVEFFYGAPDLKGVVFDFDPPPAPEDKPVEAYPSFRWESGGKWYRHVGFKDSATLAREIRSTLPGPLQALVGNR